MREVYSNPSGIVLRDGDDVRIEYVPEPGVKSSFGVLTGGEAYRAEDLVVVEFAQYVPSLGNPGRLRKFTLIASDARPNLRDLALRALEEMGDR